MKQPFEWREAPDAELAVVGDPVDHSLSPKMQQAALAEMELPWKYVAIRVPKHEFREAAEKLRDQGYVGLNVTVPLKEAAFAWSVPHSEVDRRIGAINTLRLSDRVGRNTDAPGLIETIAAKRGETQGAVLVLGAGGTARAALVALSSAGYRLVAWNRTQSKLRELVRNLGLDVEIVDEPDPTGCSTVLNCTSAQLSDESPPVRWERASQGCLAIDAMYGEKPTRFLSLASQNGLVTTDGKTLLVAQGALSLAWWTGRTPSRQAMLEAIR